MLNLTRNGGSTDVERSLISNYLESDGCLYYRHRLCIPRDIALRRLILLEAHDSMMSGHPGYVKTSVRKCYFWSGMKRDVLNYVKSCLSCQRIKAERVKMPKKLEPLVILEMKWECISMDFINGLPTVQGGYNCKESPPPPF